MRIVFFGIPEAGLICFNAIMQKQKNVIAVVPPVATHPAHSIMVNTAKQYSVPVLCFEKSPKEEDFIRSFKELNADVAFVCAFDHLLPQELLDIPPLGFINCHPSLLPEYRGGNPYFHTILNDEKKTGITIHYMDNAFDTGDIITQWECRVEPNETLGTLFTRLNFQSAQMIIETMESLERGETLPRRTQQKTGNYKKAPNVWPDKGDTLIDWSKDSAYIERFTRALNPFFGAITNYRSCTLKIWSGFSLPDSKSSKYKPGSIVKVSKETIAIATGNGVFFPSCIQIGNFAITDVKDFIKRTNPQEGELFGNN